MFEFTYLWVFLLLLLPLIINRLPLYYISKRSALRISFKEDIDAITGIQSDVSGISRASNMQKVMGFVLFLLIVTALAKTYVHR